MPYVHAEDSGRIHFWRRKCVVCGKVWPVKVLFQTKYPDDMTFVKRDVVISKGKTSYASWAEKFPQAAFVASRLPNWPRWARIGFVLLCVAITVVIIYLIK